ncbi:hypothetical protein PM082_013307 [Marasmius tenuissimus]|nr:hypothetical protein PM082_013307 [Marasmius tenuissimus]
MEVFEGKVGTQDVLVKALKKQPDNGDLKLLSKCTLILQTLEHSNILPFLGLYYFNELTDLGLTQLLGKAADKSEDSDKYNCAYALHKLYRGSAPLERLPSRPPHVSDEIWGVLQGWLMKANNSKSNTKDSPPSTQTPVPDPQRKGLQDYTHLPIVAQNHDVLSHASHFNNSNNAHFSAIGGNQLNSNANRTQNINCGRDHNLNISETGNAWRYGSMRFHAVPYLRHTGMKQGGHAWSE